MPADATPKPITPQQLLKAELQNLNWPREGGVVDAELIKKESRAAYFDLGRFGTGILYGVEFANARDIIRRLTVGERVPAKIVDLDGEQGCIELSVTEASRQRLWQQVQDLQESGDIVNVKVVGVNPSGLLVNILDLKGFLPLSQLSAEHYSREGEEDRSKHLEALKELIGQELAVKVLSVNSKKNKLIVSERDTVSVNIKELLANYAVDQTVDGMVSGIADFGIFVRFVDNPEIEGLIHISEIEHRIVDNPKEMVQMNEAVKVKIIDIREGKVFLSLKALKSDPWQSVSELVKEGQEIHGLVYKLNPFGALVNFENGLQGAIHVSEFGGTDEMKKALTPGEKYQFVIDGVKPEEKRIVLKLKK